MNKQRLRPLTHPLEAATIIWCQKTRRVLWALDLLMMMMNYTVGILGSNCACAKLQDAVVVTKIINICANNANKKAAKMNVWLKTQRKPAIGNTPPNCGRPLMTSSGQRAKTGTWLRRWKDDAIGWMHRHCTHRHIVVRLDFNVHSILSSCDMYLS